MLIIAGFLAEDWMDPGCEDRGESRPLAVNPGEMTALCRWLICEPSRRHETERLQLAHPADLDGRNSSCCWPGSGL